MRRFKLPTALFAVFFVCLVKSNAQTTLAAGDLVFVGYNSAGTDDDFSFVLLTAISSGTQIRFTDFGWCSDINGFQSANPCGANTGAVTDGAVTWTSASALPCGTQVRIQCQTSLSASTGTVTGLQATFNNASQYISLATGGESIFAFQGSLGSPTLISALNMNGGWDATLLQCTFTSSLSTLPAALAFHNLVKSPETDNARYDCSTVSALPANLRTAIYNNSNWTGTDGLVNVYALPIACTFSCNACTAPSISANPPNRTICAGANTTFGITAAGTGLSYQWQENTGSGFTNLSASSTYVNVTTNTLTINGATAGMSGYLYCCVVTGTCGSATSTNGTLTVSTVSGSTIITNTSCFGGSNGSINLTPSGGTSPYTYNWGGGITTEDRTGLAAGTYTVTITDANGCTGSVSATITQPAIISGSTIVTNIACFGISSGSIDLTPSGGTPGYTYNWGGGITTQDRTGLAAGTYTVTITDANGCTRSVSATVTQPPTAVSGSTVVTNVACFGGSNGSINLTPSGGTPGYTYNWGGGITTQDRTGLAAGTYTVTITDANGCTGNVSATITQPAAPVSGSTVVTNVSCSGGSDGSINLTPSGGTPGYTYNWGGGITTQDRTGLAAGTYTVTITDDNGCTGTASATITQPSSTPGSNSYSLPTTDQTVINTAGNANYVTGSCELVTSVVASGTNPVSGSVTNKVWIEGSVPTESGSPFVQRHYEITPATNPSTATGTVTLYFTQDEFDNFNAHAASTLDLPADPSDNAGKANLRIGKYSGVSGDATGLPSSYSSSTTVINPDDNNIVWNAVSNAWEVTFAVDGFSGFIVQTNLFTLPVTWVFFTVKKQNQSVIINWSTAAEQNTKDFIVQHSIDGVSWNTAAILAAAGNSSSLRNYTYVHNNPGKGYNYYRVMQTDLDGKFSYSEVRMVNMSGDYAAFTIAGNRISNGVLQLQIHQTTTISFYDVNGKMLWVKQFTPGLQSMDVSSYSKGVYLLNAEGKAQKIFIQ